MGTKTSFSNLKVVSVFTDRTVLVLGKVFVVSPAKERTELEKTKKPAPAYFGSCLT